MNKTSGERELRAVAAESAAFGTALEAALDGTGAALLPVYAGRPAAAAEQPLPATVPAEIAVVVETSGSTGVPKRVALSADALFASARATNEILGDPHWLLALPSHYIAGLQVRVRALAAGVELTECAPSATAAEFAAAVDRVPGPRRASALVPAQLARLLDTATGRAALARLDAVLVGGQRLPNPVAESAEQAGVTIVRTYGSSETAGGCVYDGRPMPGCEVRTVEGEIWLHTPALAAEYLGDSELSADRFVELDGKRWFRTSDAGRIDDGVLTVTGRRDRVIVSGGEKVLLDAIEHVVRELPGFADAVVIPARSEAWGEVPIVVTAMGGADDAARRLVRDACRAALGRAAAPDRIERIERMPMLASGKPDRIAIVRIVAGRGETLDDRG